MNNAFIIHGAYGKPNENWIPWLKQELEGNGYKVTVPAFPTPDGQNYDNWMQITEPYLTDFNEETVLIGHSIGASFTLAVLEKLNVKIKKTVLVSGFVGPLGLELDEINKTIAERVLDWDKVRANSTEFVVFHGNDDQYVPDSKAEELGELLGVEPVFVQEGGHLNEAAGFTEFPLLLSKIV